jgi:hypothetical protein
VINFRYHIISLVAVFLALGVGLALGSAFIDTAVVNRLEQNIDTLSGQKDDLQRENAQLEEHVDAVEELGEEAGAELLGGRLDGVPVFGLAVRGIDEEPVEQTTATLADADADYRGTLWLTERLTLEDESDREDLVRVLGMEPALVDDAEALREALVLRLGNALANPLRVEDPIESIDPDETESEAPDTEEPAVITALRLAGFIEYEPPADESADTGIQLPFSGARMVVVSGEGAVVDDEEVLVPVMRQLTSTGPQPMIAGQSVDPDPPDDEEPSRTGFVGVIRDDDDLRATVSTVDDLELFIGRVAAVLALEQSADGLVGHYGLGSGADQIVPVRPEGE